MQQIIVRYTVTPATVSHTQPPTFGVPHIIQ